MSSVLKPCPFCGGNGRFSYGFGYEIYCEECGSRGNTYPSKEQAIARWNKRLSLWQTGTPIEGGWYLTKVTDVDKPYEALKFENGKWSDYLDYDDVPEVVNDSFVLAYQKIEPFNEDTV